MDILKAIEGRRSVRAFLDRPVAKETVTKIFEAARWAPSGVNHQPWKAAILGGELRQTLAESIIEARETKTPENPDYSYYPKDWFEPYKSRRVACGQALYGALNIKRDDLEQRKKQWYKNYHFFYAPVGIIFYLDSKLAQGSWMDMGGFIQSFMIAARAFELETCAQASLAEYPDIVRSHLGLSDNYAIACGMALGYADWQDPVNQYRTERESPSEFIKWID